MLGHWYPLLFAGTSNVPQQVIQQQDLGGNAAHARAQHLRRMQEIDEQDVEDIVMMFSLFRSIGRG